MLQKLWICVSPHLQSYVLISPFEILPYHNYLSFTPLSLVTHVFLLLIYIHPPNKCWNSKILCALVQLLSHVQLFATPWIVAFQTSLLPRPWNFPGKNTGASCHFLLQRIFPTQGSNLRLLHLQVDSLPLSKAISKPMLYFEKSLWEHKRPMIFFTCQGFCHK